MLQLDHITIIAPSLTEGVDHVRTCLDIDVPFGRHHDYMGTYNHLLRLGEAVYLEIIAVNPDAPRPARPRWFGLDDPQSVRAAWDDGRRLRGWVVRTNEIDSLLSRHGAALGEKVELTANNGSFFFSIPRDGSLPLGEAMPSVIDRRGKSPPVAPMADLGARLQSLTIEHPDPDRIADLYRQLAIEAPPRVQKGERIHYRAEIRTPSGLRVLT